MTAFNLFKPRNNINRVTLPEPDDSVHFFECLKEKSEKLWTDLIPDKRVYGFQFQPGSRWRPGLSNTELEEFERAVGFRFPAPLANFYNTMNGLTKPGVNIFGNRGIPATFRSVFYSFPGDLQLIKDQIDWIYEATGVRKEDLERTGVSKIFPVFSHRFMIIDIPGNPILSMNGEDIIYYAENLSKLLVNEIFVGAIDNISDFESPPQAKPEINFWLDNDAAKA